MIRARVDIDEPFYLEKCVACGGIWFDKGERRKIIEGNFTEHLKDLWSRSWQSKQRKEQSRTRFLEINEEVLGKEVFQAIIELAEQLKQHPEKGRAIALLQQEIS
jgi:Zn-finger nucleic acid-binding protein